MKEHTDTYWSMYYQYACHANFANWKRETWEWSWESWATVFRGAWDLEIDRPNVGYFKTIATLCNPS